MSMLVTVLWLDDTDFLRWGSSPEYKPNLFVTGVQRGSNDYGQLYQALGDIEARKVFCLFHDVHIFL